MTVRGVQFVEPIVVTADGVSQGEADRVAGLALEKLGFLVALVQRGWNETVAVQLDGRHYTAAIFRTCLPRVHVTPGAAP